MYTVYYNYRFEQANENFDIREVNDEKTFATKVEAMTFALEYTQSLPGADPVVKAVSGIVIYFRCIEDYNVLGISDDPMCVALVEENK